MSSGGSSVRWRWRSEKDVVEMGVWVRVLPYGSRLGELENGGYKTAEAIQETEMQN